MSQVAVLQLTSFLQVFLSARNIPVRILTQSVTVSRGRWYEGKLSCFLITTEVQVRTKGWLNSFKLYEFRSWLKEFDLRFEVENIITNEFYTFFRNTSSTFSKIPKCSIYTKVPENVNVMSFQNSIESYGSSNITAHLASAVFRNCKTFHVIFQNVLTRDENESRVELKMESANCSKNIVPQSLSVEGSEQSSDILTYVTISISCLIVSLTLFYNLPRLEYGTLPSRACTHLMVTHSFALACYILCPSAKNFPRSRDIASILLHYLWLASFAWTSITCIHVYTLVIKSSSESKKEKEAIPSAFRTRISTVTGYFLPFVVVVPFVGFKYCSCADRTVDYDGFACMPSEMVVILLSYGVPVIISCLISTVSLAVSFRALPQVPPQQPWQTFRIIYVAMLFYVSGMVVAWTVALYAMITSNGTLWQLYLVLQMFHAGTLSVGFLIGRSHARVVQEKPKGRLKW